MSTQNIDEQKNQLLISEITTSDTISQFMEKCNNNFSAIIKNGGGPTGPKGEEGGQGAPVKPKVPIHVWIEKNEYNYEELINENEFRLNYNEDLSDPKYQEGHLIMLKNAHVYILELDNFELKPKYILGLQTFDPGDVINGENAYMHIAYANNSNNFDGFVTDQELRGETISTYNLRRDVRNVNSDIDMPYMGIYSDNNQNPSTNPNRYTWVKIQGVGIQGEQGIQGIQGEKGEKGDKGDGYTGHPYTIDVEGDMSTISVSSVNGTRLYANDYCECVIHSYYGDENVELNKNNVTIGLPEDYIFSNDNTTIVLKSNKNNKVGTIVKTQQNNDVIIRFTPDETFVFPKKQLIFPISVVSTIYDEDAKQDYKFDRKTIWTIKGITSTFELEIIPSHRTIKKNEDGSCDPKTLSVNVYKIEDKERTLFDLNQNTDFKLLYKNYNSNDWEEYTSAIDTQDVSCLEFKVVKYHNSTDSEFPEELWDYEDVWVVADGKSTHYYHADLGSTESMMVLTTGRKITKQTKNGQVDCAELKNNSGYSITFDPKFFDGTEPLTVDNISIDNGGDNEYYSNDSFVRELKDNIFTVTSVPYGVDMIPMTFKVESTNGKSDIVSFNIYISTLSDIYTLVPTVSSYNTSTGKTNDKIGCSVYKNNSIVNISELSNLTLSYNIYNEKNSNYKNGTYNDSVKLIYGGTGNNGFTASDVAIEFILKYHDTVVVKSTVPLIKDGINGKDGDCWQYIFCRSPKYPFDKTDISDPSGWVKDPNPENSNSEYLGDNEIDYSTITENLKWYDDHKGVDSTYKYEYQSYRKWKKNEKCWGQYTTPTLYSNYSEDGNGYSILLSNPVATIPVGDDWKADEGLEIQTDETLVYFYNNTTDLSKDSNVSISIPDEYKTYFSSQKNSEQVNKVIFTPIKDNKIFDFGSNKPYTVPIILEYNDTFKTTINWTLTPLKGLEDVEVFVDKMVVNTTTETIHNIKVGYYLTLSNGDKKLIKTSSTNSSTPNYNSKGYKIFIRENIDNWDYTTDDNYLSSWSGASYDFSNGNCYVVLTNKEQTSILDYTVITTVKDGQKGDPGEKGNTPTLNSIEIKGYSLNPNESIDSNNWVPIDTLDISPGQTIYILNEYNWSTGTKKVVTSTIAGSQGIDGKSRVLFYLGSFKDGTLTGESVNGKLTDDRCDYYIDNSGQAWMRTGTEENATANPDGYTSDNDEWKKSEKVGFLQAGAIHADMINTGSLVANEGFVATLFAKDVEAKNLKVEAANIQGILSATQIDVEELNVSKLNTTQGEFKNGTIDIQGNEINIYDKDSSIEIIKITGDYLDKIPSETDGNLSTYAYAGNAYNIITSTPTTNDYFYYGGNYQYWRWVGVKKLGSFTIPGDGYPYKLNDIEYTINYNLINNGSSNQYDTKLSWDLVYIEKSNSNEPSITIDFDGKNYITKNNIFSDSSTSSNTSIKNFSQPSIVNNSGSDKTYDLYIKYNIYIKEYSVLQNILPRAVDKEIIQTPPQIFQSTKCNLKTITFKITTKSASLSRVVNSRCDISSYGFRYFASSDKYAELTKDGTFIFKNGKYTLAVDDKGIGLGFQKIDEGKVKQIVPRKFKFRVYNDAYEADGRWATMTLLALGADLELEDGND